MSILSHVISFFLGAITLAVLGYVGLVQFLKYMAKKNAKFLAARGQAQSIADASAAADDSSEEPSSVAVLGKSMSKDQMLENFPKGIEDFPLERAANPRAKRKPDDPAIPYVVCFTIRMKKRERKRILIFFVFCFVLFLIFFLCAEKWET
jgi:hypothetical protein